MAERANDIPSLLARCIQPFYRSLTSLHQNHTLDLLVAMRLAVGSTALFLLALFYKGDNVQLMLLLLPTVFLACYIYDNSTWFAFGMRWSILQKNVYVSTVKSLFLLTFSVIAAYAGRHLQLPWTYFFTLALAERLHGLWCWLVLVHNVGPDQTYLLAVRRLLWSLSFGNFCPDDLPTAFILFAVAIPLSWGVMVSFWLTVIVILLSSLLALHACWADISPGLSSVMGLYGTLLLILAFVLTVFRAGACWLPLAGVLSYYHALSFISCSTIYQVRVTP